MRGLWILVLTFALAGASLPAHAGLNFDFSITNTLGNVSGTVTGEIFGLSDNTADQAATDIEILTYPTGITGLPAAPFDIFGFPNTTITSNEFTVSGGVITAMDFVDYYPHAIGQLDLDYNGLYFLSNSSVTGYVTTVQSGFTITPASTSDLPEPASIVLLLSGLFGLRMIRRRRIGTARR